MRFLGVDPGLSGALACTWSDGQAEVWDVPTFQIEKSGHMRSEYDISELSRLVGLLKSNDDDPIHMAMLEQVSAMPKQGVTSMFSLGVGYGMWKALLVAHHIPYTSVSATRWKRMMLPDMDRTSKDASRLRATQLFPSMSYALSLKKHHGRAEALLLAAYAKRTAKL